jgi:hypothetical protein
VFKRKAEKGMPEVEAAKEKDAKMKDILNGFGALICTSFIARDDDFFSC